jgi:arylsulfatase A-like enzyme
MVARLLDALNSAGKLDNTYIFFTSDNGYHLGEHRLPIGKRTLYEEDIRVPLIVRGPGVPPGAVLPHIVGNVDLAPTFAELAGVAVPDFVDGRSFASLLLPDPPDPSGFRDALLLEHSESGETSAPDESGPNATSAPSGTLEPKDPIESQSPRNVKAIDIPGFSGLRLRDTVYAEYTTGEREMYDLRVDPFELDNISPGADPATLAALSARLDLLRHCAGATCR